MVEYLNGWTKHIPQMLAVSITPSYRWRNRKSAWQSYLLAIIHIVRGKAGTPTQACPTRGCWSFTLLSSPGCSGAKSYPTLRPHGLQHTRLPCPSPCPRICSDSHPLSQWCHPSHPLLPPPPALNLSQHRGLFQWVGCSHQMAKVLVLQHQFSQWLFRVNFF